MLFDDGRGRGGGGCESDVVGDEGKVGAGRRRLAMSLRVLKELHHLIGNDVGDDGVQKRRANDDEDDEREEGMTE